MNNKNSKKLIKKPIQIQSKSLKSDLINDIRRMIVEARTAVAVTVNTGITLLYWRIGKRIKDETLKGKRAVYGEKILQTVSAKLESEYGNGFSEKNIRRMIQFVECFPDEKIVVTLSRQLSWSHFVAILPLRSQLAKDFYSQMCRIEQWNVRTLRKKIGSMLFERTALSKKQNSLIKTELKQLKEKDKLTPDLVFRDPYFLDFLGLKDSFQEKDLEAAILREMEAFILELGAGFSFVARQKRIIVDGEDFYIDLLFYNRNLRRLVAIELKIDKFKPDYKGQMELYLRWLDKYERKQGEEHPIGLILCAGKSEEQIELLELCKSGIRVAEYMIEFLPKEVLQKKLHEAIKFARKRLALRQEKKIEIG